MKELNHKNKAEDPAIPAKVKRRLKFFDTVEELEAFSRKKSAELSPLERLQHMRLLINWAYGIKGFDPKHIVCNHSITIRNDC